MNFVWVMGASGVGRFLEVAATITTDHGDHEAGQQKHGEHAGNAHESQGERAVLTDDRVVLEAEEQHLIDDVADLVRCRFDEAADDAQQALRVSRRRIGGSGRPLRRPRPTNRPKTGE